MLVNIGLFFIGTFIGYVLAAFMHSASTYSRDEEKNKGDNNE